MKGFIFYMKTTMFPIPASNLRLRGGWGSN